MIWRWLRNVFTRGATPPTDERSTQSERLDRLTLEADRTLDRVDKVVPPSRHARLRREAILAEQRMRGR